MTEWAPPDHLAVTLEFVTVNQTLLETSVASVLLRGSTILIVKSATVIPMESQRTSLPWEDVPRFPRVSCASARMPSRAGFVTRASLCSGTCEAAIPRDVSLVDVTGMEQSG